MISPLILFLLILSLLVFIHELGHFIAARKNGVDVEEFGLGLPPRAIGKKIGRTLYSLNWLPIGGFVKIKGESLEGYDPKDETNFINKKPWQKGVILLAGVFMNFVLGIGIFYIVLAINGWKSNPILLMNDYKFKYGETIEIPNIITYIGDESPAKEAGLQFGDQIKSISYEGEVKQINEVEDIKSFLDDKDGVEVQIATTNIGTGEENEYGLVPRYNDDAGQVAMGVGLGSAVKVEYATRPQKALAGFLHSFNIISYSTNIMGNLISQSFQDKNLSSVSSGVSGPVGIFGAVKSILLYGGDKAAITILDLMGILSISLAVMNLLPIPALDGGRFLFVLYEGITKKRIPVKFEEKAHQIGFLFLMGLLIVITFKDIWQMF